MTDIEHHEEPKKKGKKSKRREKSGHLDSIFEPIQRLDRDLRSAAVTLSDREARFLVDSYYLMQENRKRGRSQELALSTSKEPHEVIAWFGDQADRLERQIERALDAYSQAHLTGDWLRGLFGVGPVLAAGFQAYIYMGKWCRTCHSRTAERCAERQDAAAKEARAEKKPLPARHDWTPIDACPTVGHIYGFAGIAGDKQVKWERGEKRPWNATLKTLAWKFSDVAVKFSNDDRCYYGKLYRERKEKETANNTSGQFAAIAAERLARPKRSKEAKYHEQGILSPGHIDLRARRWAAKRFLGDLHTVWWWLEKGTLPPMPYPLAYLGDKHTRYQIPIAAMPDLLVAIEKHYKIKG